MGVQWVPAFKGSLTDECIKFATLKPVPGLKPIFFARARQDI